MPPKVMASARPASASCLRPNCSRLFTGTAVAARSRTIVSITVSITARPQGGGPRWVAPSRARVGGRSRGRTKGRRDQRATGFTVHQHGIGLRPGLAVDNDDTGALGSEMLVAPSEQCPQHRPKLATGLGQDVFVARRSFAVAAALEQTRFDQSLEPARQDIGCNPEALLELVKPRQAERRIAQNENAPPLPDPLQAAGDRALHVAEALMPHGFAPRVTCMLKAR